MLPRLVRMRHPNGPAAGVAAAVPAAGQHAAAAAVAEIVADAALAEQLGDAVESVAFSNGVEIDFDAGLEEMNCVALGVKLDIAEADVFEGDGDFIVGG